jgi:AcrR family transcriptional regulator
MARKTHSSPEQAKQAILDAAEAMMIKVGPAGLRISAVAKSAGMAHPNIIYHFGSRDGLINAIAERVGVRATKRITNAITEATKAKPQDRVAAMTHVLDVAYAGDQGKAAVWLHMSGAESSFKDNMERIVELSHSLRRSIDPNANLDNTGRLVMLVTLALVGEVVSGDGVKDALGFNPNSGGRAYFRQWLAEILLNLTNEQWSTSLDNNELNNSSKEG